MHEVVREEGTNSKKTMDSFSAILNSPPVALTLTKETFSKVDVVYR